jgi:hypothetical protein
MMQAVNLPSNPLLRGIGKDFGVGASLWGAILVFSLRHLQFASHRDAPTQAQGYLHPQSSARKSVGACPCQRLNAREKLLISENPNRNEISLMDKREFWI